MDAILGVVKAIGAGLLAWKLAKMLLPNLGVAQEHMNKIAAILTSLVAAAVVVRLVYEFDKSYIETGKLGYLIADDLVTAIGAAVAGLATWKGFGNAKFGWAAAGIIVTLSALTSIAVIYDHVSTDGFDTRTALLAINTAAKGALAGSLIAKALGFSMLKGGAIGFVVTAALTAFVTYLGNMKNPDNSVWEDAVSGIVSVATSALAGTVVAKALGFSKLLGGGLGFSITATAALLVAAGSVSEKKGITWSVIGLDALAIITSGLTGALAAVGLGASIGTGAILGVAAGLALTAIVTLVGATLHQKSLKMMVAWGAMSLTAKEIEEKAKSMFAFDVNAKEDYYGDH